MKKLLFMAALMLAASFAFVSCNKDDESEARVPYQGKCDSIFFSDSADVVFEQYINDVFATKGIAFTGIQSLFYEEAKTNVSSVYYAQAVCDGQAKVTYENLLKTLTSNDVRKALVNTYGDSIDFSGLDNFDVVFGLYGIDVTNNIYKVAEFRRYY